MPPPLQVENIFVFIRQVAPVPACWLFKTSATSWPLTFLPWKWCPSHVWRGLYLCANFSLPRPLCSRLRPDVHDRRQTDRRQTASSLNASAL